MSSLATPRLTITAELNDRRSAAAATSTGTPAIMGTRSGNGMELIKRS